jgi:GTPase
MDATSARPEQETRTGYVTLLGAPNVGKSSLLNRFLGQTLSIVTPRAQTTWKRITGILTDETCQMIFLDTPGILDPADLLQRSFLASAREAVREADVLLLVLDPTRPLDDARRERLAALSREAGAPILAAVNKIDVADPDAVEREAGWIQGRLPAGLHRVSATTGEGTDGLLAAVRDHLPPGPFLYPPDEIATEPVRFFAAELVRETIFEEFRQEVPYSVFCQVEEFREDESPIYIQVNIFVERASQKGILIGEKGSSIRHLGIRSREKLEHFLEGPVYLDLWIKVLPRWRKKRQHLKRLGFHVPEDDASTPS